MLDEETQRLAERIAHLLREKEVDGSASLRASLEKINRRLDRIESQIFSQQTTSPSAFRHLHLNHPSEQKFEIAEAGAPEILEHLEMEKACPYEPAGKPCDHCAMCSSRGF